MESSKKDGNSDFLNGLDEITAYLQVSDAIFRELVSQGLPARNHNNRWYANKKNVDLWHLHWTAINEKNNIKEEGNRGTP